MTLKRLSKWSSGDKKADKIINNSSSSFFFSQSNALLANLILEALFYEVGEGKDKAGVRESVIRFKCFNFCIESYRE